jgi:hypothetical protein
MVMWVDGTFSQGHVLQPYNQERSEEARAVQKEGITSASLALAPFHFEITNTSTKASNAATDPNACIKPKIPSSSTRPSSHFYTTWLHLDLETQKRSVPSSFLSFERHQYTHFQTHTHTLLLLPPPLPPHKSGLLCSCSPHTQSVALHSTPFHSSSTSLKQEHTHSVAYF